MQTIQRKLTEANKSLRLLDVPVLVDQRERYLEYYQGEDPAVVALKYARLLGLEVRGRGGGAVVRPLATRLSTSFPSGVPRCDGSDA